MDKLHAAQQFVPSPASIRRILRHYGLTLVTYEAATSGLENLTLKVETEHDKYVLRVYRQDKKSDAEIERELDFMGVLRQNGLPLPPILSTTQGKSYLVLETERKRWQCILMAFVPGQHPSAYTPVLAAHMATLQAGMHNIGEGYAKAHGISCEYHTLRDTEFADDLLAKGKFALDEGGLDEGGLDEGGLDEAVRAFVERASTCAVELSAALSWGISHFDYDADNLLADAEARVTAILDFDDAQCLPLVVCLGYTLWDIMVSTDDASALLDGYLRAYQAVRPLSPAEVALLPSVMLVRHYMITTCDMTLGDLSQSRFAAALRDETRIKGLSQWLEPVLRSVAGRSDEQS